MIEAQYEFLGAAPIPMPFSKVYDALKLGLVDGQENAWSNIYSKRFYEWQKYFADIGHSFLGYMVVTSTDFWEGLPADVRAELEAIIQEVSLEVNRIAREKAESDRQKVIDTGVVEVTGLSEEEIAAWRKALKPVWQKFERQIGKDVIDAAVAANE